MHVYPLDLRFKEAPQGYEQGRSWCNILLCAVNTLWINSQFHYCKCIDCDETIHGIPLCNFELSSISSIL